MDREQLEEFIEQELLNMCDCCPISLTLESIMDAVAKYTESQLDIYLME